MIKTLTVKTAEIDDEKLAVEEITAQLAAAGKLMKNTVGIVVCHYEFVLSGVLKAVCNALPFEVVGTISSFQSVAAETGSLLLTLMVMTGDDTDLVISLTPSLLNEPKQAIAATYRAVSRPQKPALILAFAPFILQNSGDEYIDVLSEVSGGVPCFGTLAVDDTADFSNCCMLANGEPYRDCMALLLIYGDIRPRFYIANISANRMLEKSAVVTKSMGHILMEVNGRPAIEYLADLGLVQASETRDALSSLPFLLDYNDGSPRVAKIALSLTPEKYVVCAGAMPEGSTLDMALVNREDILFTTGEALDLIRQDLADASGMLIYSCIARRTTLAADQFGETALIQQKIGTELPYMAACSGGEICPTSYSAQKAINRFHNNTFIACLF